MKIRDVIKRLEQFADMYGDDQAVCLEKDGDYVYLIGPDVREAPSELLGDHFVYFIADSLVREKGNK